MTGAQHRIPSLANRIEEALEAMTQVMGDRRLPFDVRRDIAHAHAKLHECRDRTTVAEMERKQGLRV